MSRKYFRLPLSGLRFYTGMPSIEKDEARHRFWTLKLSSLCRRSKIVEAITLPLAYRDGNVQEKGVDVRIALDIVRTARQNLCDTIIIFSQDQDFAEVVREVHAIAKEQDRWITVASAFPVSSARENNSGIRYTDWLKIDKDLYDQAIDPNNYRKRNG